MLKRQIRKIPPVCGKSFIFESDRYGSVVYTWAFKYTMLGNPGQGMSDDFLEKVWTPCYPTRCFGTLSTSQDESCFNKVGQFAFYAALIFDKLNPTWWQDNPDCLYRQDVKKNPRNGRMPVSTSEKEYARWVKKQLRLLMASSSPRTCLS